jgi:hypothetical protein
MNLFVNTRFVERLSTLAVGIEPVDFAAGGRVPQGVELAIEQVPQPSWLWRPPRQGQDINDILPRMERHATCRYVVRYRPGLLDHVNVRVIDRSRQFVGRRFEIPVETAAQVAADEAAEVRTGMGALMPEPRSRRPFRTRRPSLFPGAAYPASSGATGLRGSVARAGAPLRWVRVEARLNGGELVGRAHGDDRGEFLLLVALPPTHVGVVTDPLAVTLTVFASDTPPAPIRPDLPALDPYWDLPQELLAPPGTRSDLVADGATPPSGYRPAATTWTVRLPLGTVSSSAINPFPFT